MKPGLSAKVRQATAAILTGFLSAALYAADYEPVTVDVSPAELLPGTWMVQGQAGVASSANEGFNSNAGFVVTTDGVVVFDALGSPSLGNELLRQIRRISDLPIRKLVISHYHSDHFYGAQPFADLGIPVIAQRYVVDHYLKSEAPVARLAERRQSLFPWVNESSRITPPDTLVDDKLTFRVGQQTFRVFHTGPAHTPEDLMMLVEPAGVLFAGDLIFAGRLPWVGTADTRAWLAALDKVAQYKPRVIVPGHGSPSTNAAADLAMTREYLAYLREQMGSAVNELMEFDEAYADTDWSQFAALPTFELANRVNAYNVFLQMQRELLGN